MFAKNSAFTQPHLEAMDPPAVFVHEDQTDHPLDQAIYDLNEVSEDLHLTSSMGQDQVRELHQRIEDIRDEVYRCLH